MSPSPWWRLCWDICCSKQKPVMHGIKTPRGESPWGVRFNERFGFAKHPLSSVATVVTCPAYFEEETMIGAGLDRLPFHPNWLGVIGNYAICLSHREAAHFTNNGRKRNSVRDNQHCIRGVEAGNVVQGGVDSPGNFSNCFAARRADAVRVHDALLP